jgi:hypothetical protein
MQLQLVDMFVMAFDVVKEHREALPQLQVAGCLKQQQQQQQQQQQRRSRQQQQQQQQQ